MGLFTQHYGDGDERPRVLEWIFIPLALIIFVVIPVSVLFTGPWTTQMGNAQLAELGWRLLFLGLTWGGIALAIAGIFKMKPLWIIVGILTALGSYIIFWWLLYG